MISSGKNILTKSKRNKQSAGILVYKFDSLQSNDHQKLIDKGINSQKTETCQNKNIGVLKFLLVHPGGPFWSKKHELSWTIPKGEFEDEEDMQETAKRELIEETGINVEGPLINLGSIKQKGGKTVFAFAYECPECDGKIKCTSFVDIEYPPRSGKMIKFPEVDKGGLFNIVEAKKLINPAQYEFLEKLEKLLKK
jgi:predicted NUDIX family NTP pyrophosphohydrolase